MANKEKMNRVLLNNKDLRALEGLEKEVRKQLEEIALATPPHLRTELKTTYYSLGFLILEEEPGYEDLKAKADLLEILLRELRDDLKLIENYDLQTKHDGWFLPRSIDEVPPIEEFGAVIKFYPAQFLGETHTETVNVKEGGAKKLPHKKDLVALFLTNNGDLCKDPKNRGKDCYPMKESGKRLELLKYFIEKRKATPRFIPTREIATDFGKTETGGIRGMIGKINDRAYDRLKIGSKRKNKKGKYQVVNGLIEGRQNSGYRLNLDITIKLIGIGNP